jgi:2-desacetyl-2-hydroxyethyl bacteriochlorophyllide A dehydrogenase
MRYVEINAGQAQLRTGDLPELNPGWARVRVRACGVCGTDVHLLKGMVLPPGAAYPIRPGHEVAGILEEMPGDCSSLQVGDQVVLHPLSVCDQCPACHSGEEQRCDRQRVLGIHEPGGLADVVSWPVSRMLPARGLEPGVAAIMADAVATAHHALRTADLQPGEALCVLGAGGVGTHVLQIAQALVPGVRMVAVVRSESSAERVAALGVEVRTGLEGAGKWARGQLGGCDVVVDFTGDAAAPAEAIRALARGGRLILGSVVDEPLALGRSSTVLTRELQIIGAYTSNLGDLAAVIELARSGRLDLSGSVTHRRPLAQAPQAIDEVARHIPGLVRMVVEVGN